MGGGSSGGMMGNSNLTCASCHGFNGRGGTSTMMGIQTMNAPDIRWSALKNEFDAEKFRLAVTKGQDPDGKKQLNNYMPRWNIGNYLFLWWLGFSEGGLPRNPQQNWHDDPGCPCDHRSICLQRGSIGFDFLEGFASIFARHI